MLIRGCVWQGLGGHNRCDRCRELVSTKVANCQLRWRRDINLHKVSDTGASGASLKWRKMTSEFLQGVCLDFVYYTCIGLYVLLSACAVVINLQLVNKVSSEKHRRVFGLSYAKSKLSGDLHINVCRFIYNKSMV